jgi:hypothetical protein
MTIRCLLNADGSSFTGQDLEAMKLDPRDCAFALGAFDQHWF